MPILPAYCRNCDRWFSTPFGFLENATNVEFSGLNMICGKCGGNAPIVDGVYNAVGDTIEIVKSYDLSDEELKALTRILQEGIARNTPAGQIREIIAREVPKASGLNKLIIDNAGLYALLTLILATLQVVVPLFTSSGNNQIDTEKIIKAILESKTKNVSEPKKDAKTGVNAPCWCGSGKKRKKCHGLKSRPNPPSNLNKKPK